MQMRYLILAAAIVTSVSASAQGAGKVFTGGGYGSTAQGAIQSARGDAENSASAEGLYTCQQVGEARVFTGGRRPFNAEVDLSCTP